MGLDASLEQALNDQITLEYASAYAYTAFGAWLDAESLPGMASWMAAQAAEELTHAQKFARFVLDRGNRVRLGAITAPRDAFESPLEVFELALAHEQKVTAAINALYAAAVDAKDYASLPLLDWFVDEQVEEESTVQQIIDDLRRAGSEGHALLMIDRELGTRTTAGAAEA
jgi:ferritin